MIVSVFEMRESLLAALFFLYLSKEEYIMATRNGKTKPKGQMQQKAQAERCHPWHLPDLQGTRSARRIIIR
jgi:hypothetical protein